MHIWHRLSLLWGLLLDLSPTTTALSAICVLIFFLSVLGIELGATHLLDKLYHLSHVPSPFALYLVFHIGSPYFAWAELKLSTFLSLPLE